MRFRVGLLYLIAFIRFGSIEAAARYLDVQPKAVKQGLWRFREQFGAKSTAHLAYLMFPRYGDLFHIAPAVGKDSRSLVQRRRAA